MENDNNERVGGRRAVSGWLLLRERCADRDIAGLGGVTHLAVKAARVGI